MTDTDAAQTNAARTNAARTIIRHVAVFDPETAQTTPDQTVLLENKRIATITPIAAPAPPEDANTNEVETVEIDGRDLTLMPGLIDAHVHVMACTVDLSAMRALPHSYVQATAIKELGAMLSRGFTSVRDTGGADPGLARAIAERLIPGPRLLAGGPALSQTGGHGDQRAQGETCLPCGAGLSLVCDGIDAMRSATRELLRRGARHVKVMLGGGIASPSDGMEDVQYSRVELEAVVDEVSRAGRYVTGHAYTPASIRHGLEAGVRWFEHGNFIDQATASRLAETGSVLVPTLAAYAELAERGAENGLPRAQQEKVAGVLEAGLQSLDICRREGVTMLFGTDLLGELRVAQGREFSLRAAVLPLAEVIRSATVEAARYLALPSDSATMRQGAPADLILVKGDPLANHNVLANGATNVVAVFTEGQIVYEQAGFTWRRRPSPPAV